MIERPALDERAQRAVRVPETLARGRPVVEARGQAVGSLRLVDEVVLVDSEILQQFEDGGLRGLGESRGHRLGRLDDMN